MTKDQQAAEEYVNEIMRETGVDLCEDEQESIKQYYLDGIAHGEKNGWEAAKEKSWEEINVAGKPRYECDKYETFESWQEAKKSDE